MGLIQDLHEAGVFLRIDKVEISIHIICLKSFDSVAFLLISKIHNFSFFLLQVGFSQVGVLFNFTRLFLMELYKLFLMLQKFL